MQPQQQTPVTAFMHAAAQAPAFSQAVAQLPSPVAVHLPMLPLPAPVPLQPPAPLSAVGTVAISHACHVTGASFAHVKDMVHSMVSDLSGERIKKLASSVYSSGEQSLDAASHVLNAVQATKADGIASATTMSAWADALRATAKAAGSLKETKSMASVRAEAWPAGPSSPTTTQSMDTGAWSLSDTDTAPASASAVDVERWISTLPLSSEGTITFTRQGAEDVPLGTVAWAREPMRSALERWGVKAVVLCTPVSYHMRPTGGHAVSYVCGISGTDTSPHTVAGTVSVQEGETGIGEVHLYHAHHLQRHLQHCTRHPHTGQLLAPPGGVAAEGAGGSTHTHLRGARGMEHTVGVRAACNKGRALIAAQSSILCRGHIRKNLAGIPAIGPLFQEEDGGSQEFSHSPAYNLGVTAVCNALVQAHHALH